MKNTMTKGEIRHELAKAKKELKDAWICGEGYDYDQNFIVCYKDGTVLETREANERLPQIGIIGIQFFGTDAHYTVGYEMYNGEKVLIEDESEDACYRVEYLPLTSTEAEQTEIEETVENAAESAEVHLDEEIAEAFEKQKTSFKFYDVDIAYQVERYVNCGSLKYVQLGTYSDYAKAVQAAQEAIEEWGEEHIYFHTVEAAKRNSKVAKDKYDKKILKSEKKEIDYYWYASRLTDSKESVYISIDSPIRIPIETTQKSEMEEVEETAETETEELIKTA